MRQRKRERQKGMDVELKIQISTKHQISFEYYTQATPTQNTIDDKLESDKHTHTQELCTRFKGF